MKKLNVLIVEDNEIVLQLHKNLVEKAGFTPILAKSFADVKNLEHLFEDIFCSIIDYSLPDALNGEVISYLLEHNVPGIVMTGMIDDDVRDHILSLPVIDYVSKENKHAFTHTQNLLIKLRVNHLTKILIVDNNPEYLNFLDSLLKRHNFTVLLARCGEQAIQQLEDNPNIKLVITDKELPNIDGLELCNAIRSIYNKNKIAIIGLSNAEDKSLTAKFIKNGANDFLAKPFCLEEFYCRVIQNIEFLESLEIISKQANTDYLTQLYNRRYFFEQVSPVINRRANRNIKSTLAMMDIDNFKIINDTYGHDIGDIVLKKTAELMEQYFTNNWLPARIGGEEFCVFLDDLTRNDAIDLLETFRQEIENTSIKVNTFTLKFTVSIGLTHGCDESFDDIMIKADDLLYEAKENGRNLVISD